MTTLQERRAELRYQIQQYDSFWNGRYRGKAGRAYGRVQADKLRQELVQVEAALGIPQPRRDFFDKAMLSIIFGIIACVAIWVTVASILGALGVIQ